MKTVAEGKDAVLEYLEKEALKRSGGQAGVYRLERDDAGNLVVMLAGHIFIGSGITSIGGNRLLVLDGIVVSIQTR